MILRGMVYILECNATELNKTLQFSAKYSIQFTMLPCTIMSHSSTSVDILLFGFFAHIIDRQRCLDAYHQLPMH